MRWSRISFAKKIHMARMLTAGIKRFLSRLKHMGMDENYVEEIETLTRKALELKHKQNHLRSELKLATAELQSVLETLGTKVSKGKATVKVEMDQLLWTSFGINDKR